eukprot:gene23927-biopygen10397
MHHTQWSATGCRTSGALNSGAGPEGSGALALGRRGAGGAQGDDGAAGAAHRGRNRGDGKMRRRRRRRGECGEMVGNEKTAAPQAPQWVEDKKVPKPAVPRARGSPPHARPANALLQCQRVTRPRWAARVPEVTGQARATPAPPRASVLSCHVAFPTAAHARSGRANDTDGCSLAFQRLSREPLSAILSVRLAEARFPVGPLPALPPLPRPLPPPTQPQRKNSITSTPALDVLREINVAVGMVGRRQGAKKALVASMVLPSLRGSFTHPVFLK